MKVSSYKYKNITISGLPGAGSTTLLEMLKEALEFDGWRGFSGGEFMRAYATEKGLFDNKLKLHHSATAYDDDFDRQVDMGIREKVSEGSRWIIESWLSGFMAQGVPETLKILMICSDESVRVDRIVNRDDVTVNTAKQHIGERYEDNLKKWKRMYANEWKKWLVDTKKVAADAPIDFWRPDIYDLVIDTYSTNKEQTLKKVLDALKKT